MKPQEEFRKWLPYLAHMMRGGGYSSYFQLGSYRSHYFTIVRPECPWLGQSDVLFNINPFPEPCNGRRPRKADICAANVLFADLDAKAFDSPRACLAHLSRLDPQPSVAVATGGGYHCYWLLKEPVPLESDAMKDFWRMVCVGWAIGCGSDRAAADITRLGRLPGTLNGKYSPPREVRILCARDIIYDEHDLAQKAMEAYNLDEHARLKARYWMEEVPVPSGVVWRSRVTEKLTEKFSKMLAGEKEGNRNNLLYWCARVLAARNGLDEQAQRALVAAGMAAGLSERECNATVRSAIRSAIEASRAGADQ